MIIINKLLLFKKLSFYSFFLLRLLSIIIDYTKEEYYTYSVFETSVDIVSLVFGFVFVILFFFCRKKHPAQMSEGKKLLLPILCFLLITVINGYVLGLYFEPFFDTFGVNVNAYTSQSLSSLRYNDDGSTSIALYGGTVLHTETSGNETYYLLEDGTPVLFTEKQSTVSFYPQGDKLYCTVSRWKDCLAVKYGYTNSLVHNGDTLCCYDFSTGKSQAVYTADKNSRILYADEKVTVLFDIAEKNLYIKETYSDKITYREESFLMFNNSFSFETDYDYIDIRAFWHYKFNFDGSDTGGALTVLNEKPSPLR